MLLTYTELTHLLDTGVVRGAHKAHVGAASLDVVLGSKIMVEAPCGGASSVVDLFDKQTPALREIDMLKTGYFDLAPGQFCLAETVERFFLPDDVAAEVKMRSSLARSGLDHALAGWADPGWNNSVLTLELTNSLRYHALRLRPGLKIAQMIFWRGERVPEHASYAVRGRYNHDTGVQASKGVR